MSWSDDTRCLHCDGKLPLYRKVTSGQFCSAAHRKAYWLEQERLAVERLHQTHDSLRAYRPPEALQPPRREPAAAPVAEPLPAYAGYAEGPSVEERARSASNTGQVKFAGFLVEAKPDARVLAGDATPAEFAALSPDDSAQQWVLPLWCAAPGVTLWESTPGSPVPFFDATAVISADVAVLKQGSARLLPSPSTQSANLPLRLAAAVETPEFVQGFVANLLALEASVVEPVLELVALEPKTETAAPPQEVMPEPTPAPPAGLRALPRIGSRIYECSPRLASLELLPGGSALRACYPRISNVDGACAVPALRGSADLVPLAIANAPRKPETQLLRADDPRAMDLNLTLDSPQMEIDLPALAPALRFAPGSRYSMSGGGQIPAASRGTNVKAAEAPRLLDLKTQEFTGNDVQAVGLTPQTGLRFASGCTYAVTFRPGQIGKAPIRQPETNLAASKPGIAIVPLPAGFGVTEFAPAFPGLRPLSFQAKAKAQEPAHPMKTGVVRADPAHQPMQRAAKWEPIEGELQPPPKTGFLSSWSQAMSHLGGNQTGEGGDGEKKYVWSHVADFWQHAPRDLKLLSIAIPVLLGLALRPSLPKVHVTAPAAPTVVQASSFQRGLRERLMVVRETVAERAGVELNEDFRTGLDDWQTRGDLSTAWSFDENGFVKPGTLALYRPSLGLKDYEMEFLGLIDKKALSWVVRAADFDNYYVVKLVVLKPGPMPTLGITRYAVINGKAEKRVDTIAAINARTDTLYRVNVSVHDDSFLLTLQGQVIDNWSEPRLASGGIGFFSQQGEQSRLRWLQVTHQYDMLGRLCAYLAPYNISNTNGSW
jgi:hypothetical protein